MLIGTCCKYMKLVFIVSGMLKIGRNSHINLSLSYNERFNIYSRENR
ncbi:Uncharacterised protein [Serratia fonticola]|nr:Uncharacterised protein [Serratia fonticola]